MQCVQCNKIVENLGKRFKYCSPECRLKNKEVTLQCKNCNSNFVTHKHSGKKYCNKNCMCEYNRNNENCGWKMPMYERWLKKYGKDIADEKMLAFRTVVSDLALISAQSDTMKQVYADFTKRTIERNKKNKGKTFEEQYGNEKAAEIKLKKSLATTGEKNPAYGKVYSKGGRSVKGYYKTLFFRSLLEYSFMKHLEILGYDLLIDIDYECFHIKYEVNNVQRTYTPDFFLKKEKILYEVKPYYRLTHESIILKAKAAKEFCVELGIQYIIMTEKDFLKINFETATKDENVKFDERTFKYFRKQENVD